MKIIFFYRYIIYTLHSMMQCSDQRRVFKTPASGVRKIILSTNIAETSVTINDVVFVIDAGKVKEVKLKKKCRCNGRFVE